MNAHISSHRWVSVGDRVRFSVGEGTERLHVQQTTLIAHCSHTSYTQVYIRTSIDVQKTSPAPSGLLFAHATVYMIIHSQP